MTLLRPRPLGGLIHMYPFFYVAIKPVRLWKG